MQEIETDNAKQLASLLLELMVKFNQNTDIEPYEVLQSLSWALWNYVFMASRPGNIQENINNALEVMKIGAEKSMTHAEDVYWKHYEKISGVGHS